jgi:hypothetical protein
LAIVQNYMLTRTPGPDQACRQLAQPATRGSAANRFARARAQGWLLRRRERSLDEEEAPSAAEFEHLLTLKKCCEAFTEEFQQELSELMYKEVHRRTAKEIEAAFCESEAVLTPPPPPPSKRSRRRAASAKGKARRGAADAADAPADGTPASGLGSMPDLLRKYDTDGSIANLMELERENPEAMLEPDDLEQVQLGSQQTQCAACRAMCKVGLTRVKKRKALRDEDRISEVVSNLCVGTPAGDDSYPKYPGNPPLWGELYTVRRGGGGSGVWEMRKLPKGAMAEEASGELGYDALLIKHAIIQRACRATLAESEVDLAELIYTEPTVTTARLQAAYCEPLCRDAPGGGGALKDEV